MEIGQAVLEAGGVVTWGDLTSAFTRAEVDAALTAGTLVRLRRDAYAVQGIDRDRSAAAALGGVLDRLSAARAWGWGVKLPPDAPQVVVPRGRNVDRLRRRGADLRWGAPTDEERARGVTSRVQTVLDCARFLDLDAALAVADSALRDGVSRTELLLACARLPRTGRSRAYRVVELADARAANPFESVLRAALLAVPGTRFEPQVWVGSIGRPDLVDRELRLVVEADSFEFHADSASLLGDMERYNAFVAADHLVVRFGWKHAMFRQDYVRAVVTGVVATRRRSVRPCGGCVAA